MKFQIRKEEVAKIWLTVPGDFITLEGEPLQDNGTVERHCADCAIPLGMSHPPSFTCWNTCPCHRKEEITEEELDKSIDLLVKETTAPTIKEQLKDELQLAKALSKCEPGCYNWVWVKENPDVRGCAAHHSIKDIEELPEYAVANGQEETPEFWNRLKINELVKGFNTLKNRIKN